MSQPIGGNDDHVVVFRSAKKKPINLIEDAEIFIPVKFP